jgi:hypothetical protein
MRRRIIEQLDKERAEVEKDIEELKEREDRLGGTLGKQVSGWITSSSIGRAIGRAKAGHLCGT